MKQKLQFSKGTTLLSHFLKNQWKLLVLTIFIFNIQYQNCQGQAGTALDFDGFDDFVEADNSFDFYSGDFTVEVWFKAAPVSSLGTASSIFNLIDENQTNEGALFLGLNFNGFGHPDNGKMRVNVRPGFDFIGGENFYSTTALDDNTWHHAALTRKSDGFLRLYIDGTLNATSSNAVANITSAKDGLINIGRNAPNAPRLFKGQLDEVRIWTVGLETSDISSLYNKTFTGVINSTCLDAYYKFDDGSGTTASNSSSQSNPSRYASLYNMNNSDWVSSSASVTGAGISGCSTSLPVELISFIGKIGEDKVSTDLVWQTASEENNEGFEIERSQDGKNWETLDFVLGNGTTTEIQDYNYTDYDALEGIVYYRLKQIDFDGQFEYSDIINVKLEITNYELRIFPNPVQDELNIIDGEGEATIYNMLGQPVRQFLITNTQFSINLRDLSKGQYVLRIQQENGEMKTKQFSK